VQDGTGIIKGAFNAL